MAITSEHEAFARDVVAVAKKHGMDKLRLTFDLGFELARKHGFENWGEVQMSWQEPREGEDTFHLKAEQHANFPSNK